MEAKRKQQEDAAKAELASFIEEFQGGPDERQKQFVRGGVVGTPQPGDNIASRPRPPPAPQLRTGSGPPRSMFGTASEDASDGDDIDGESIDGAQLGGKGRGGARVEAPPMRRKEAVLPTKPPVSHKKDQRPSQMVAFMEELRREQEERDRQGERDSLTARQEISVTSFDNQDPESTNLYVGNLPPTATEVRQHTRATLEGGGGGMDGVTHACWAHGPICSVANTPCAHISAPDNILSRCCRSHYLTFLPPMATSNP